MCLSPPRVAALGTRPDQNTLSGRNCTEIRGPAWATLGTACSQVRWQEPPMTSRSPWPIGPNRSPPRVAEPSRRGSPTRRSRPSCPGSCRGRSGHRARPRCRGRPGSSTARGRERLASSGSSARTGPARPLEDRVGERLAGPVDVEQAGYGDHPSYICRRSARHGTSREHRREDPRRPRAARGRAHVDQAPRVSSRREAGRRSAPQSLGAPHEERTLEVHDASLRQIRTVCSSADPARPPGQPNWPGW